MEENNHEGTVTNNCDSLLQKPVENSEDTTPKINGVAFDIYEMKNRIIFGIPLFDTEGNPFPDDLMQSYLDSAISWAEMTLNITIIPREEEEYHDYLASDYLNWNFIKLWKKPVLEKPTLEMWYGDQKMLTIPEDWIKVDNLAGHIQIFPVSGSAGGMIISKGGNLWQPLIQGKMGYAPSMWKIKYKAGMTEPEKGKAPKKTDIHYLLKDLIYRKTAMGVMGVWGDLIIGAGIANQSVGIDGLSQSIGTTQSAMFGGASSRIKQLQEDIDNMLPVLRSYYGGIDMVVV